jgi:hypothetical protein
MIQLPCPGCEGTVSFEMPMPEELGCAGCHIVVQVVDPAPIPVVHAAA